MRAAIVVIVATVVGMLGLLSFHPQSFGAFVGSNGALSTVQLGPQPPGTTTGSSTGVSTGSTGQTRAKPVGVQRSTRPVPRVTPATGTRVRRCRVVINGQRMLVNTRDGRKAQVSLPGGGRITLPCLPARTPQGR